MKKSSAIRLLCGKNGNQADVAKVLKISEAAVSKWPDDKIPEFRELQIKQIVEKRKAKKARREGKHA